MRSAELNGVKAISKDEITRRYLTHANLVEAIGKSGIAGTEASIRDKIACGGSSAVSFVQCLGAVEARTIHLHPDQESHGNSTHQNGKKC